MEVHLGKSICALDELLLVLLKVHIGSMPMMMMRKGASGRC